MRKITMAGLAILLASFSPAYAQVKIGVSVSATGPAATLGIPERNAITLAPKTIGEQSVEYIVLDDASDPTAARRNIERLTSEDNVDIVIGSSTSPASLAMVEVAGRTMTPMISMGASRAIVHPMDEDKKWVFKTPYNDAITAAATVQDMQSAGIETVATIAFNDAYGEGWINEFTPLAREAGIEIVTSEYYARNDTSVTAQTLKVMSADPDAVLIVASGTPGVLPQAALRQRGYDGTIYQTTGVVNDDFLRVGGAAVEGTLIAGAPISVAEQLLEDHPAKEAATTFTTRYEDAFGEGSTSAFAGYAWDAILIAQAGIEEALKSGAEPGTEQFRSALRDAIEALEGLPTTAGPVTMTPDEHNGYASDAPVMIEVTDGEFSVKK